MVSHKSETTIKLLLKMTSIPKEWTKVKQNKQTKEPHISSSCTTIFNLENLQSPCSIHLGVEKAGIETMHG